MRRPTSTAPPTGRRRDADGRWSGTTYANGVTGTRQHDRAGNPQELSYAAGAYTYSRTDANLLATSTPSDGASGAAETYGCTPAGKLASTTGVTTGPVWAYDAADRITRTPEGTTFDYDTVDQLTTSTPPAARPRRSATTSGTTGPAPGRVPTPRPVTATTSATS